MTTASDDDGDREEQEEEDYDHDDDDDDDIDDHSTINLLTAKAQILAFSQYADCSTTK